MNDSFIIGAYWGARSESLCQVKDRVIQTLVKLSKIDDQFSNWYETGMSRKRALEKMIVLDDEIIERLCLERVKKGELDKNGFAKMGFLFSLWTGHQDDESTSISFNVGKGIKVLGNNCVLSIPFEGAARERLLKPEKAKDIISILVEIWKPNYAVLTSGGLRDKMDAGNKVGWITYLDSIRRIPKISSKVIYEKYGEGHLFYLANENGYDYTLAKELLPLKGWSNKLCQLLSKNRYH